MPLPNDNGGLGGSGSESDMMEIIIWTPPSNTIDLLDLGRNWTRLGSIGLDWIGLDWIGLDWIGLDRTFSSFGTRDI